MSESDAAAGDDPPAPDEKCDYCRLAVPEEMERSMSDWNRHLHGVAARSTTRVQDPSNTQSVLNGLENCLDDVVDEDDEEGWWSSTR